MSNAQYLASLVNSSGNINIPVSNAGINFNNSSATGASTLTDYETGTYTPTLFCSGSSYTYLAQYGWYTKVGALVTVGGTIQINTVTSAGSGQLNLSLPFTAQSGGNDEVSCASIGYRTNWSSNFPSSGYVAHNQNYIQLTTNPTGSTTTSISGANVASSCYLDFSVTYVTNF